jgi:hypothetical protein
MSATAIENRVSRRDVRVDHVGFVDELDKHFGKPTREAIKQRMKEGKLDLSEADFFEGLLVESNTSTIDPAKFFNLFCKGRMKKAEFLSAISIGKKAASVFMSQKEIDAISASEPATPKLMISRRKGAEIKLVDAVRGLASAIGER